MQEHKIKIEIDKDGKISAETFGIEGTECVDELMNLLKDLGEIETLKKKPEYYQTINNKSINNLKITK